MSSTCAACNAPTPPNELTLSLDGRGMICQTCSLSARAAQQRAGTRKAYWIGALIVGAFILVVLGRIVLPNLLR